MPIIIYHYCVYKILFQSCPSFEIKAVYNRMKESSQNKSYLVKAFEWLRKTPLDMMALTLVSISYDDAGHAFFLRVHPDRYLTVCQQSQML